MNRVRAAKALLWLAGTTVATGLHAADDAMSVARRVLRNTHGGQTFAMAAVDRLEYRSKEGASAVGVDADVWFGTDLHKLAVETQAQYTVEDGRFDDAEVELLYRRAVRPFWDLQVGLRHEFSPGDDNTGAVFGVRGTAPMWIDVETALIADEGGGTGISFEAEHELLLAGWWSLVSRVDISHGLASAGTAELGLRLKYRLTGQIAPYVGVSWQRRYGNDHAASEARSRGPRELWAVVAGLHFWL